MDEDYKCKAGAHRFTKEAAEKNKFKCPLDGTPIALDDDDADDAKPAPQ